MKDIAWKQIQAGGIDYFALLNCRDLRETRHAFSTRRGGVSPVPFHSLNLGRSTEDKPDNVEMNRKRFLHCLQVPGGSFRTLRQVHSTKIHWVEEAEEWPASGREGDGLITDQPGLLLGVLTADCCPILLIDPQKRVVAAVHAGWKGSLGGIAGEVVRLMNLRRGCNPAEMTALIGPTIGSCCYQVGPEVWNAFHARHEFAAACFTPDTDSCGNIRMDRWNLDLSTFHCLLLQKNGLLKEKIYSLSRCTRCHPQLFFSYRRDGSQTGRMLSVVGLL